MEGQVIDFLSSLSAASNTSEDDSRRDSEDVIIVLFYDHQSVIILRQNSSLCSCHHGAIGQTEDTDQKKKSFIFKYETCSRLLQSDILYSFILLLRFKLFRDQLALSLRQSILILHTVTGMGHGSEFLLSLPNLITSTPLGETLLHSSVMRLRTRAEGHSLQ